MARYRSTMLLAVLLAGLVSAGCQTTTSEAELIKGGVPEGATLIGQGAGFVYRVPDDGRIYIVRGDKVEKVQQVRAGAPFYSIGPAPGEEETKDFDNLRYYFEPVNMPRK